MKARLLFLLVLGGAAFLAQAQTPAQSSECGGPIACSLALCDEAADDAQRFHGCLWRVYETIDDKLDRIYKAALQKVAHTGPAEERAAWKEALEQSQWLWVQLRDQDCRAVLNHEWAEKTGAPSATALCMIRQTQERAVNLARRYEIDEAQIAAAPR